MPDFGGIKRVNLDLDIINYQNWELAYSGDFDFILNIGDSFVFTNENNVFFNENGTFSQVISLSQTIKKIVINEGKIIITSEDKIFIYDTNFNLINSSIISSNFNTNFNSSELYINQTIINDNFLYATLPDFGGIKRVSLDSDIINYQNWELIYPGDFNFILNLNDSFIFSNENNVFLSQNSTSTLVISLPQPIKEITINEGEIIITSEDKIFIYDTNFNLISSSIIGSNFNTTFNSSILYNNYIYVATSSEGLLKINTNNIQQNYSILPVGPLYNNVFSISSLYGSLWATFGDYTSTYNPYPLSKKRG